MYEQPSRQRLATATIETDTSSVTVSRLVTPISCHYTQAYLDAIGSAIGSSLMKHFEGSSEKCIEALMAAVLELGMGDSASIARAVMFIERKLVGLKELQSDLEAEEQAAEDDLRSRDRKPK